MSIDQDPDLGDLLQNLFDRVSETEQTVTSTAVMGSPAGSNVFPSGIIVGGILVTTTPPTAPTAITVLPSTFFDDIVADVSWTPASGTTAVRYQVEVAWKNGSVFELAQQLNTGGTQVRVTRLRPNSVYGVRVYPINYLNIVGSPYPSSGWQEFSTTEDTTIPGLPTSLTLYAGFRTITATWVGVADQDVVDGHGLYQIQAATDSGFATIVVDKYVGGTIAGLTNLSPVTMYWVRVRAIDAAGNSGPWTAGSSTTTIAAAGIDIQDGVIVTDHIAVAGLDAAVITFGTMSGDRITANSMDVASLKTSTLAAKDIILGAGGQIKTASLTPGIVLNSQGLSLYNSSGTRTVFLEAASGSATFTGTVTGSTIVGTDISGGTIVGSILKTAASGERVQIDTTPTNEVQFYTSEGNVGWMLGTGSGGTSIMELSGVQYSGFPSPPRIQMYSSSAGRQDVDIRGSLHVNGAAHHFYAGDVKVWDAFEVDGLTTLSNVDAGNIQTGDLDVFGDFVIHASSGTATIDCVLQVASSNPVRTAMLEREDGGGAYMRMTSGNKISFGWSSPYVFVYIDDTYVGGLTPA